MKHVAVLMGGWSAEREVSLRSGKACADALERTGYKVSRVDVNRDIAATLRELKPDVALNVLHGRPGEDGTIQGVLEVLGIPYSHSGVLASALAMQKDRAKVTLRDAGVLIVTEAHAHPPQELYRDDWAYGDFVLCERYVAGQELTCAVLGEEALDVIEIIPTVSFYDYEAKYAPGGSRHLLPAPVSPNVYQLVRRLSLLAHRALGCRGVSRADFRYDDRMEGTQGLVCLEVNTQPGMTETSLVPELAAYAGITFDELVRWMVEDASLNR